jgi:PAS domain S-box-containing protein
MISANAALSGSYDYGEVARSVLIAIAASYAALDLAGRVTAARGRVRLAWLSGGAIAMGIGIWAMHFKGMLAFHLPVPVKYHWPTVLASLLVAIFASAVALYATSRHKMDRVEALTGSVIMGAAIAGMHYIGMAAMRMPAIAHYSPLLVTCSILLAVLFSLIALLMAFGLREETRWSVLRRLGSAIVMGAAVSAMHYTGMAAASFFPASPPDLFHALSIPPLGNYGVFIATLIVLVAAIATSSVDRMAKAEIQQLNEELERRVAERTSQLEAINQALRKEIAERERAEEAVKRSEEHLRLVIDTIPQRIWSGAPDGSLDFFNAQWRSYTGLTHEELQGEGWQRMLHPDDRERALKVWRESVRNGTPFEQEVRHRRADGQYRWFLVRGVPLRDPDGRVVRWYGTSTDIEDRKRAEDAVWRSEENLRLVIDLIPQQIMSGPNDGTLDYANAQWRSYTGLTQEELQGRGWQRIIHPDDLESLLKAVEESRAQGTPYEQEVRRRGADGQYRWFLARGVPLKDSEGCVVRWYGSNTDIQDRKEAEDRIRLVIDTAPAMLHSARPDGYVDFFNKRWLEYVGASLEDIRGWGWTNVIHPEDVEEVVGKWRSSVATGRPFEAEARFRRSDGEYRLMLLRKVPLRDETGSVVKWYGSAIDIEDRKRAEEQLRQAQEDLARVTRVVAMGELAAAIAHEVNQPLGAVVTNASASLRWLAGQPPNLEEAREAIDRTVREANRASDVIRRIRALLQKGPPQMERLDLNAVIREVLILASNELLRSDVAVHTDLAADVPNVLGDRVQLQQVLLNLILNGIDAMSTITDRPRELLIKLAKHPDGVLIQVHDSGEGVDPEQAIHIFEPFFTTKPQGIGMGLSVGRSIVEAHGGRLWFTPGPSHGVVFQFTVPKADASDERAA